MRAYKNSQEVVFKQRLGGKTYKQHGVVVGFRNRHYLVKNKYNQVQAIYGNKMKLKKAIAKPIPATTEVLKFKGYNDVSQNEIIAKKLDLIAKQIRFTNLGIALIGLLLAFCKYL